MNWRYMDLTPDRRDQVIDWVRLHGIDPHDVPTEGFVGLDGSEYRIEVYQRGPNGVCLTEDRSKAITKIVRREAKALLPAWMVTSG
jgi:hypothetical protein